MAAARARESARPDRLFDDPWAGRLAGEAGEAALRASEAVTGENRFLPVRTRFVDEAVLSASSWSDQLVLLGAGYDTRAFRLPLPGRIRVFEVDHAEVLARKDAVLETAGAVTPLERVVVAADLEDDWSSALVMAGFDPSATTTWVAEGVLFYLDGATVGRLLEGSGTLSHARAALCLDTFGPGLLRLPGMAMALRQREASGLEPPFCTASPSELLARHG